MGLFYKDLPSGLLQLLYVALVMVKQKHVYLCVGVGCLCVFTCRYECHVYSENAKSVLKFCVK